MFITGHGDIPMAVRAMKVGAVEFLPKPFREHDLLDAVSTRIRRSDERRAGDVAGRARSERATTRSPTASAKCSARSCDGTLNKQVGAALGVSEQTVKVHRHNIMRKMGAASLPDLVRMIEALRTDATNPLDTAVRVMFLRTGAQEVHAFGVETMGIEPTTPCLQSRCSAN